MLDEDISRRGFLGTMLAAPLSLAAASGDWIELFDGSSLNGWRPSENKNSWKVVDGRLAANGPRSHLFYTGAANGADFKNFELIVELSTKPECNSGIYFHTAYQETGFPDKGFEIQINNTAKGDGGYLERKKTASLYGIRNMYKQLVPDEKPFQIHVAVRGKNVQIHLNDQLVVDYVEPTPAVIPVGGEKQRFLDRGTFALQCHNDGSKAFYRSVRVRPLPDNLAVYISAPPVADDVFRKVINIGRHNVPMLDYHAYLRPGLTLEKALQKSRADGIQLGITAESVGIKNDAAAEEWLKPLAGKPVFFALNAANGQWTRNLSPRVAQRFDYVLGDCRTWRNERSRTIDLTSAAQTEDIKDRQSFMESFVGQITARLDAEPIDIYAHPTYLPASFRPEASQLWTQARIIRLIDALLRNKVTIELDSLDRLPGKSFIQQAKEAGCKFAFGTANKTNSDLRRCEYGLEMVEACQLTWQNFFAPGAWWPKAVDRRGSSIS